MIDEGYVPDHLNQDRIEGRFQDHYELMFKRREMAGIYNTSHGHCKNCRTVVNLQAKGIGCKHSKCYILAHSYNESQTEDQVNFKDSSASSDTHRTSRRVANPTYRTSGFGIQQNHR